MPETVERCPLCGSTQCDIFDQRMFRGQMVTNRLCSNCGLVYQSPRKNEDEMGAFYEREYRQLYQGQEGPGSKDLLVQKARAESLLSFAKPHLSGVARHLDIGCSAGLLLQRFAETFDCQPTGIEPGAAYRKYTQALGLTVYASLEELQAALTAPEDHSNQAETGRFDLISMIHVLEHLPHPVEYLSDLRENTLTGDGWVLLEVPNLYCHDCFEVAHTISFSEHTLAQTLKKAGFDIMASLQHGQPRSALHPLYLTTLARPAKTTRRFQLEPEHGVKRKRQLGLLRRRILTRLYPKRAWIRIQNS
jgi:2-polyprenyl-3-methyl-5-hydroxy-6-metoxy-1,4-benzoquinol methylase